MQSEFIHLHIWIVFIFVSSWPFYFSCFQIYTYAPLWIYSINLKSTSTMYIRLSDTFRNILSDFEAATAEVNSQKMLAKYNTTICIFLTIIFSIFSKTAQFFYFCRMPTFTNNNFFVDTDLHVPSPILLVSLATLFIYSLSFSIKLAIRKCAK